MPPKLNERYLQRSPPRSRNPNIPSYISDVRMNPSNWVILTSRTSDPGRQYYFNLITNETRWEFPEDNDEVEVSQPRPSRPPQPPRPHIRRETSLQPHLLQPNNSALRELLGGNRPTFRGEITSAGPRHIEALNILREIITNELRSATPQQTEESTMLITDYLAQINNELTSATPQQIEDVNILQEINRYVPITNELRSATPQQTEESTMLITDYLAHLAQINNELRSAGPRHMEAVNILPEAINRPVPNTERSNLVDHINDMNKRRTENELFQFWVNRRYTHVLFIPSKSNNYDTISMNSWYWKQIMRLMTEQHVSSYYDLENFYTRTPELHTDNIDSISSFLNSTIDQNKSQNPYHQIEYDRSAIDSEDEDVEDEDEYEDRRERLFF